MQKFSPIYIKELASVPWKNGGGSTRTLAVEPPGAGMDAFLWRISMAEIEVDGPFSSFPDIDRTILLWRGAGVALHSTMWPTHRLIQPCEPFEFRGEDPVDCKLIDGPTTDLNLMSRRNAVRIVCNVHSSGSLLHETADHCIVICNRGSLQVEDSSQSSTLQTDQMMHLPGPVDALRFTPMQTETIYLSILIRAREWTSQAASSGEPPKTDHFSIDSAP